MTQGKIKLGMIGGGKGSFIGPVHRMAATMDNLFEISCGAFSSNPRVSLESGHEWHLPENKIYPSYTAMIKEESALPMHERIDAVAIVTPNHHHFEPARLALENGFHVILDKPLTYSLEEAMRLQAIVQSTGMLLAVTHAYTGYPMIKEARHMIQSGKLGKIRKIMCEYPQGWLSDLVESSGQKQASWRTDPSKSGKSCTMGDIGIHALNLAEYVSGLEVSEICADLYTMVEGRMLDDDGNVLLRFENGANGILMASQVCTGEENNVNLRVYGELGSIEWRQMEPNTLVVRWKDQHMQCLRTGVGDLSESAKIHARVPAGHPEGYIEAFANVYRNFGLAIVARAKGEKPNPLHDYPGIEEGVRGMLFIDKVLESSQSQTKWTRV